MIKKGWKYIVVLLCLICLVGCGSSNIGTPGEQGNSSNQGEVDLSSYEYFADWFSYLHGTDESPLVDVVFWNEPESSYIHMIDEDTGECTARELFGRNVVNNVIYGIWYTNADTVFTCEFVGDGLASVSFIPEIPADQLNGHPDAFAYMREYFADSSGFYYDEEGYQREENRYAMMLMDCIVEASRNENGECRITFYSKEGYQAKYAEDYVYYIEKCTSYDQLLYLHKSENQLLYTGSVTANQISGGLMACTTDLNKRYFYSDGTTVWEWDKNSPTRILSSENIRFLKRKTDRPCTVCI